MTRLSTTFRLDGRTALVTGATGYLGTSIAQGLADLGAHVLVNGRHESACNALVDEIRSVGGTAEAACFDITDIPAVERFARSLESPLHILVNNAYSGRGGTVETSEADDWRQSYETAVVSPYNLVKSLIPAMDDAAARDGDAAIINLVSMYGLVSPDPRLYDSPESTNPPFYGAAKSALDQLTRYTACELGPRGIRTNAIAPGPFPNPETQAKKPEFVSSLADRVPLGRVGRANEVAGAVVFLASPAATFINGATLKVDGGWTAW